MLISCTRCECLFIVYLPNSGWLCSFSRSGSWAKPGAKANAKTTNCKLRVRTPKSHASEQVEVASTAQEASRRNVSAITTLNPSTLTHPSILSQPLDRPLPHSHRRPHLRPPCLLDRHPAQDHHAREARQVPSAVAPAAPAPQATAPISRPAALGAGKADAEDEAVSAHVPQRGHGTALVLDQQVDPYVD